MDLSHLTWSGIASAAVAVLGRFGWKVIQRDRQYLSDIREELVRQRTNCLHTLQEQSKEQTILLGKINDNIIEQNGFIKGYLQGRS